MKVMLVFDAVILLFGIYMVISSLQMKKSGSSLLQGGSGKKSMQKRARIFGGLTKIRNRTIISEIGF